MKTASRSAYGAKPLLKSLEELLKSINALVKTAAAAKGAKIRVEDPKRAAEKSKKLQKSIKASWARYTPAERAARIRKMLAGRGLKPKKKK
jgi:hypothetical protein